MFITDALIAIMVAFVDGSEFVVRELVADERSVEAGRLPSEYGIYAAKERARNRRTDVGNSSVAIATIYGVGGTHRFHVWGDGKVTLSRHHCSSWEDTAIKRADRIGMEVVR